MSNRQIQYEKRFYRQWMERDGLFKFEASIDQSDLLILSDKNLKNEALRALKVSRDELIQYIEKHSDFKTSLEPLKITNEAPTIVQAMAKAAALWDVGPMAAVAGAIAQTTGEALLSTGAREVIVENGGDIYARVLLPLRLAMYAGEASPFRDRIVFEVDAQEGLGICTSSGVVGPSLSLGRADAVVAIHSSAVYADAAATALANRIQGPEDVERVVEEVRVQGGLKGVIACAKDRLGLFGDLRLVKP